MTGKEARHDSRASKWETISSDGGQECIQGDKNQTGEGKVNKGTETTRGAEITKATEIRTRLVDCLPVESYACTTCPKSLSGPKGPFQNCIHGPGTASAASPHGAPRDSEAEAERSIFFFTCFDSEEIIENSSVAASPWAS
jgi:hypothetical protein